MIQTLPVLKSAGRQGMLIVALGFTGHAMAQSQSSSSSSSSSHSEGGTEALLRANPAVRALSLGQMNTISDQARASRGVGGSRTAGLGLGTGLAGAAGDGRWNGWAAQSHNAVGFGFAPLASSGHVNSTLFGADYSLAGGSLIGVAIGGDSSRTTTTFNNGSVGTNGYSIAPYFMMPMGARWTLDGSIGFGSGNVSQNAGAGVSGATSERRTFGSLGLTYATTYGNWQLEGNGALLVANTTQGRFVQSNGAVIGEASSGLTQLRAGMRATWGSGQFTPYVGMALATDIAQTQVPNTGGQMPSNTRESVLLQAGLNINAGQKISGSVAFSSELRDQYRNNGIVGTVSFKF